VEAARWYKAIMERRWRIRKGLPEDSYKEISLEDLVLNTKPVLENLCIFLNIGWDESVLGTDLSNSNMGRWRKDFNKSQKEEIVREVEELTRELGYE